MAWTVEVKLIGRRNGEPAPGVGTVQFVGHFTNRRRAEAARDSWERDPAFIFEARLVRAYQPNGRGFFWRGRWRTA